MSGYTIPDKGALRYWYDRAKAGNIEYADSAFWQTFLQWQFPQPDYSVIAEHHPNDHSRRRIDIIIYYHEVEYDSTTTLLFIEVKRESRFDADTVEDQARSAARHFFQRNPDQQSVAAMTTHSVRARMWNILRNDPNELFPFFGGPSGHKGYYVDIDGQQGSKVTNTLAALRGEETWKFGHAGLF